MAPAPGQGTTIDVGNVPRNNTSTPSRPGFHLRVRPKVREKEIKLLSHRGVKLAVQAFDNAGEWDDFTDAIYEAIPKKLRAKGSDKGNIRKWQEIYEDFDHIDWKKAFNNYIKNQIEDAIIGGAHGFGRDGRDRINQVMRDLGMDTGFGITGIGPGL